jgi:hypothetical protein
MHHPQRPARVQGAAATGEAKTPLGRRLRLLRKRIIASGQPRLSWEDLDRELAERRGER